MKLLKLNNSTRQNQEVEFFFSKIQRYTYLGCNQKNVTYTREGIGIKILMFVFDKIWTNPAKRSQIKLNLDLYCLM